VGESLPPRYRLAPNLKGCAFLVSASLPLPPSAGTPRNAPSWSRCALPALVGDTVSAVYGSRPFLPFPLIPPDGLIWGDGLICYAARPLGQAVWFGERCLFCFLSGGLIWVWLPFRKIRYALPFPLLPSGACLLWCEGFIRFYRRPQADCGQIEGEGLIRFFAPDGLTWGWWLYRPGSAVRYPSSRQPPLLYDTWGHPVRLSPAVIFGVKALHPFIALFKDAIYSALAAQLGNTSHQPPPPPYTPMRYLIRFSRGSGSYFEG